MELIFLRQAHKFIKKSDPPLRLKLREELLKIKENPRLGRKLAGTLKNLKSYHFGFVRTQYRIAYYLKDNIIIVTIATRENFYRDLRA